MWNMPEWISDLPPRHRSIGKRGYRIVQPANQLCFMLVNWRNYRRDRHRVEVELTWNAEMEMIGGPSSKVKRCLAHIKVTNKGAAPFTLI